MINCLGSRLWKCLQRLLEFSIFFIIHLVSLVNFLYNLLDRMTSHGGVRVLSYFEIFLGKIRNDVLMIILDGVIVGSSYCAATQVFLW